MNNTNEIIEQLKPAIDASVKEAISKHLAHYDSISVLPEIMTLRKAQELTGISASSMRYYHDQGLIKLHRTGKGRGKLNIFKSELIKLFKDA